MDSLLLVVGNNNLRQLYHELLFSPSIEIVPISDVTNAILFLALQKYAAAVIYIDMHNDAEAIAFLKLRQNQESLLRTKVIILSADETNARNYILESDFFVEMNKVTPGEIVKIIRDCM